MLIQFDSETSGTALGGNEPLSRSHMRDGASRNPAIQLRAGAPRRQVPVAPSRVEERTVHPFIQFLRDIALVLAGSLFLVALGVVAAIAWALVSGPK